MNGQLTAKVGATQGAVANRESQVVDQVNRLDKAICLCAQTFSELEAEAVLVLRQQPPSAVPIQDKPETEALVPLAVELRNLTQRVTDLTGVIRDCRDRLEV